MVMIEVTTLVVDTTEGMMIEVMTAAMIVATMIDDMTVIAIVMIGTTDPLRFYLRARLIRALFDVNLLPASGRVKVTLSNQAALTDSRSA